MPWPPLIAKAPDGKPDAALEKQNKDAQDKLMAATMAESAALAAVKAAEIHLKDAEAEAQSITGRQVPEQERRHRRECRHAPPRNKRRTRRRRMLAAAKQAAAKAARCSRWPCVLRGCANRRRRCAVTARCASGRVASGLPIEQRPAARATAAASLVGRRRRRFIACHRRTARRPACGAGLALGPGADARRRDGRLAVRRSRERRAVQPRRQDARGGRGRAHALGRHQPLGRRQRQADRRLEGTAFRRRAQPRLLAGRQAARLRRRGQDRAGHGHRERQASRRVRRAHPSCPGGLLPRGRPRAGHRGRRTAW